MNRFINDALTWPKEQYNKIPKLWKILGFCVLGVLIVLLLWFYGTRAVNGVSSWWYSRGTNAAHEEINRAKAEAAQSKQIAAEALAALEQEKKVTQAEKQKRELAENLLADKSKTTDEKLRIYHEALASRPVVTPVGDVDELCARAAALGVPCQ